MPNYVPVSRNAPTNPLYGRQLPPGMRCVLCRQPVRFTMQKMNWAWMYAPWGQAVGVCHKYGECPDEETLDDDWDEFV